ncbi:hypothetical protein HMPREF9126_1568 [Parvimonas sp. oral taxon 110 str. F0139]|nr:hypothetical protein HMPREF9126_1568 [Parvimonas sp. oral taxon 110 str. F0139]
MKGKYFKIKVLALVSFCLIAVGFTGSYKMLCEVQRRADEEIEKKLTYSSKEILKTEKEIKYIDLSKYEGYNVEIKKSQDEYNRITVTYKDKYFDNEANFDEKNNNKIDVITKRIDDEKSSSFNYVTKMINNSVIYNKLSYSLISPSKKEDKTKIVIEVKNPIEIMGTVNGSENNELLKKELTYSAYDKNLFSGSPIKNMLNQFNEFTIKDVNDEIIEIPKMNLKTLNYTTTNIEKLLISGDKSYYDVEYDDLPIVNIDTKNVKDFVEVDINSLTTDLNITGAKKVILEGMPRFGEIVVKYKINGEEKSFVINESKQNEKTTRKVINIESDKIFRTSLDNSLIKGKLDKISDLKEIK